MTALRQFDPPQSIHLTTEWQALTPAVRQWLSPIWNALAARPAGKAHRLAVLIGPRACHIWKTFGKGSTRGVFLHIDAEPARDYSSRLSEIKLKAKQLPVIIHNHPP
jgi:hypothetical protein